MVKIQSYNPPTFDRKAEIFRPWKVEFRAYVILNGQEYITNSTQELESDTTKVSTCERLACRGDPAKRPAIKTTGILPQLSTMFITSLSVSLLEEAGMEPVRGGIRLDGVLLPFHAAGGE